MKKFEVNLYCKWSWEDVVCRIGGERLNVLEEMTWNGQNGGVFQYFRKNNTSNDLQIGWVMQ